MAAHGYSYVSQEGFIAFLDELKQGAWAEIDTKPFQVGEPMPKKASVLDAPRLVTWKLSLLWELTKLADAVGTVTTDELIVLDQAWDSSQRRLHLQIGFYEESEDPDRSAAAGRVRATFMSGAGLVQNTLTWDKEVDFGRNQVTLARTASAAADVKLLGLEPLLADVSQKTEALAVGIGRGGDKATGSRFNRIRAAVVGCRKAFNRVHEDIAWHREHTQEGKQANLLDALQAPMQALLDRYPPGAAKAVDPAAPAPAPAT